MNGGGGGGGGGGEGGGGVAAGLKEFALFEALHGKSIGVRHLSQWFVMDVQLGVGGDCGEGQAKGAAPVVVPRKDMHSLVITREKRSGERSNHLCATAEQIRSLFTDRQQLRCGSFVSFAVCRCRV